MRGRWTSSSGCNSATNFSPSAWLRVSGSSITITGPLLYIYSPLYWIGSELPSFRRWKLFFFSFFWISDYLLRLIEVQFVVLRLFSGGPDRTHYPAVGNLQDPVPPQTQNPAPFNHTVPTIDHHPPL